MNDEKDIEAAKKYSFRHPELIDEDAIQCFLAGIQYERNRQSKVARQSYTEWLRDQIAADNPINRVSTWQAAYAQGVKDAKEMK